MLSGARGIADAFCCLNKKLEGIVRLNDIVLKHHFKGEGPEEPTKAAPTKEQRRTA